MKRWKHGQQVLLWLGVVSTILFFPLPGAEPHCCLVAAIVDENPAPLFSDTLDGYFFPWGVGWWSSLAVVFVIYTQLRRQSRPPVSMRQRENREHKTNDSNSDDIQTNPRRQS